MASSHRKRVFAIAMAVAGMLLGAAALMLLVEPPHPGKAHYQAFCGECHDRDGVVAMIEQRSRDAEWLFDAAHVKEYVADPEERAQLIAYLERELGD